MMVDGEAVPAVVVLGYGSQERRYPVSLISRSDRYAWVRFPDGCVDLAARAGEKILVSVDVLAPAD